MSELKKLIGQTFGRLTVIARAPNSAQGRARWLCRCECGNTLVTLGVSLRQGRANSCGCLRREVTGVRARTHGLSKIPEYFIWRSMKSRCSNSNDKHYKDYGGRGIKPCTRWLHSFEEFFADMGPRPSPKHSIDRIDNDSGYYPENCRWATTIEQGQNSRANRNITNHRTGETLCAAEWSRRLYGNTGLVSYRLQNGWNDRNWRALGTHAG